MHGDASRNIRFPFRQDADELKTLTDKMVKRLPFEVIALIRKLKPYKPENGGNKLLRALHDLDIIDKHMLIVATATFRRVAHSHPDETMTFRSYRTMIGDTVVSQLPLENIADEQPQITTAITFGDGQPLQGKSIVPTLTQLVDLVKERLNSRWLLSMVVPRPKARFRAHSARGHAPGLVASRDSWTSSKRRRP